LLFDGILILLDGFDMEIFSYYVFLVPEIHGKWA
jgi:hypothetical protein